VVAFGPRAGKPLRKIVLPVMEPSVPRTHESRGVGGFDLDIGPVIKAHERERLERLSRYILRPALATDRLEELPDGRLKYGFKHPWSDGTSAVVMEPLDFLSRLAVLVPAPGRHVLRYHGTLAPNAKWRSSIVPAAPAARESCDHDTAEEPPRSSRIAWADLLKRVFLVDALSCPRCNGRLRVIATVTNGAAVKAILECLGLPARPPPLAPAREAEQAGFEFEG